MRGVGRGEELASILYKSDVLEESGTCARDERAARRAGARGELNLARVIHILLRTPGSDVATSILFYCVIYWRCRPVMWDGAGRQLSQACFGACALHCILPPPTRRVGLVSAEQEGTAGWCGMLV